MKVRNKSKNAIAIIIMILFFIFSFASKTHAKEELKDTEFATPSDVYELCALELSLDYAANSTGGNGVATPKRKITQDMIDKKYAIPLTSMTTFPNNMIDATDSTAVLSITQNGREDVISKALISDVAKALNLEESDIKFEVIKGKVVYEDYAETNKESDRTKYRVNLTTPNGEVYSWCIGDSGEFKNNWYMVKVKELVKVPEFNTDLTYTAKIGNTNVGGSISNNYFYPNYDENDPQKDADVTATIKSTTNSNIVKINNIDLTVDGKPNSIGWYYVDPSDKTIIAKDYKFDNYDNLESNGIVTEKNLILTSEDGLTDTQDVCIKWPFRIIDVTQDPSTIDENTEKVTVTITTNLPIDKDKLPDGYTFTTDDEGKTQHRISKDYYKKDGDVAENITVKANGRDDTDKTEVKINWKKKESQPKVIPKTGSTTGTIFIIGAIVLISFGFIAKTKLRKIKK